MICFKYAKLFQMMDGVYRKRKDVYIKIKYWVRFENHIKRCPFPIAFRVSAIELCIVDEKTSQSKK